MPLSSASAITHLAIFYHQTGELEKAAVAFKKALNIFETNLGSAYPLTVIVMQRLAALQFDQGQTDEAVAMALDAQPLFESVLKNILFLGTEAQRLAFQQSVFPYDLLARVANQTGNAKPLANAILHNKGVVLESLIEDYQLADEPVKEEIQSLRWRLMKLPMGKKAKRDQLEIKLKQLQSGLAQQVGARGAFDLKFQDVQKALPDNSVLIEFIRYWHWVGMQHRDAYYGAVIIPKQGEPIWAALGKAEPIEQDILKYQTEMACKGQGCQLDDEQLTHLLQSLYQQVWTPIENQLPNGTQAAILSPDGELNFLSFATLLNPQKKEDEYFEEFLAQQIDLYYVASGRDLLRESQSADGETMAIYALTDWKTPPSQKQALVSVKPSLDRQVDLNLGLNKLTGTKKEADVLKNLGQSNNWTVEMFLESEAGESQLYQLLNRPPRILHFATHAVFLGIKSPTQFDWHFDLTADGIVQSPPLELLSNPMRRSFLALAGAQNTIEAWKQGNPSPLPENDGVLMAEEVSLLNLADTWITTMSACDTGRGEGRSGEGVLGLRRGFVRAGTQKPVDDLMANQGRC